MNCTVVLYSYYTVEKTYSDKKLYCYTVKVSFFPVYASKVLIYFEIELHSHLNDVSMVIDMSFFFLNGGDKAILSVRGEVFFFLQQVEPAEDAF